MFTAVPEPIAYADPWAIPLGQRLRAFARGKRKIAYYYELPDTSTFRYRAFNMAECLCADGGSDVSAAFFTLADLRDGASFIEEADALVVCRSIYNPFVVGVVAQAKARGIPVLFDCDDLVFDVTRVPLIVDTLGLDAMNKNVWLDWFSTVGGASALFQACGGFIATNSYLAAKGQDMVPGLPTAVVPNFLNRWQEEVSADLLAAKRASGWERDGRIHIGYFSGSPSHRLDFKVAEQAIFRLMRRDPRIVFRVVGFLDVGDARQEFAGRIEEVPLQDFINLQRCIAEVEINVAPLQDNAFTNCKSELKFFEAAVCGTLTVATPTFTFREAIEHGRNGLLSAAHQWDAMLDQAVSLVDRPEAYAAIAEEAAAGCRARYGWNRQSDAIINAVFQEAGRRQI